MHDVLVVYKQVEMLFDKDGNLLPYDGQFTHTISYDEKPNIQAIGGAKDRAPIQGKVTGKETANTRDMAHKLYLQVLIYKQV